MEHLQKTKKEYKNLKKQDIYDIFIMAYGDFKHLTRRTASDRILRRTAFVIAKNLKYDGYQGGFASMVYKFDKKTSGGGAK